LIHRKLPASLRGLLVVAIAVLLSACTIGGPGRTTGTATLASNKEGVAVSAVVHDYFVNALGPGDWVRMAHDSTGKLVTLAGWLIRQGIAPSESSRGAMSITSQRVTSISGTSATVALQASRSTEDYRIDYSGPVLLTKTTGGWKVADYNQNGRSVAASIFPSVTGGAASQGVGIKPIGVQLLADQVNVWTEITNRTPDQLTWDQPIVVIDSANQQRGHGSLFVSSLDSSEGFVMTPQASAFGDFQVGNATLPVSTVTFTLVAGATPKGSAKAIDLRVPVKLG
jgi:hypothetical protein